MTAQQERKRHIRAFMQAHYSDERLAQLLAHAQDGKLAYASCCCFAGAATADHALKGKQEEYTQPHYWRAMMQLAGAAAAGVAYAELCGVVRYTNPDSADEVRRRILIPMIRAEIRRRERAKLQPTTEAASVGAVA